MAEAIIAAERMVDDMEKPTRTNKGETSSRQQDGGSREQKKRKGKNMLPYQRAGNKPGKPNKEEGGGCSCFICGGPQREEPVTAQIKIN